MKELNPKQEKFCEEYVVDNNGTQAAIRAGYSKKTASQKASALLTLVKIRARLKELRAKLSVATNITAERVLLEMARISFLDPRKLYDENGNLKPVPELDIDTAASISGIDIDVVSAGKDEDKVYITTKRLRLIPKDRTLEQLGRHLGLFEDNVNVKGSLNGSVNLVWDLPEK